LVGWDVVWQRTTDKLQAVVDSSPEATSYFSDQFHTYETLVYYPGQHQALADKSQTYAVEADNAELRHYLARLARKSRCFSRCIKALWRAVKLFVFAWNRRQLFKRAHPKYPAHICDFVCP
jgi:insertion element IS1 protein InsB